MSLLEALILGVVQGLTEFLPVSSSGHLELAKALFGMEISEGLLFTIVLHGATALSTVVIFYKDILKLLAGLFSRSAKEERKFSWFILVSMIPAALVGLLWEESIDELFKQNVPLVCSMLLVTAGLLLLSDFKAAKTRNLKTPGAIIIGIMQAVAILPGISRSGATIATARMLGINPYQAARFSFLMVLPLIFGAMAKKTKDLVEQGTALEMDVATLVIGFFAAFIVGLFACKAMIAIVRKSKLRYFAIYCTVVAIVGLVTFYV